MDIPTRKWIETILARLDVLEKRIAKLEKKTVKVK